MLTRDIFLGYTRKRGGDNIVVVVISKVGSVKVEKKEKHKNDFS